MEQTVLLHNMVEAHIHFGQLQCRMKDTRVVGFVEQWEQVEIAQQVNHEELHYIFCEHSVVQASRTQACL